MFKISHEYHRNGGPVAKLEISGSLNFSLLFSKDDLGKRL